MYTLNLVWCGASVVFKTEFAIGTRNGHPTIIIASVVRNLQVTKYTCLGNFKFFHDPPWCRVNCCMPWGDWGD